MDEMIDVHKLILGDMMSRFDMTEEEAAKNICDVFKIRRRGDISVKKLAESLEFGVICSGYNDLNNVINWARKVCQF